MATFLLLVVATMTGRGNPLPALLVLPSMLVFLAMVGGVSVRTWQRRGMRAG